MKSSDRLFIIPVIGLLLVLGQAMCPRNWFRRDDKRLIEKQLHLPKGIRYLSFISSPETPGWFGREGLMIKAEIEFTDSQFREYVADLDNPDVWRPVRYPHYSPSIGESYSEAALRWSDLPLPEKMKTQFPQREPFRPDLLDATHGRYYCSVITVLKVAPPDTVGRHKHDWRAAGYREVGRACRELEDSDSRVITALAILDYDRRVMSVLIQFSG